MEILYIIEGSALVYNNDDKYTVNVGDLILFLPSTVHAIYGVNEEPMKYYVLKFDLNQLSGSVNPIASGVNYATLFANVINNEYANIYFPSKTLIGIPMGTIFSECVQEINKLQYGYQMILQSKIKELLTKLIRIWRSNGFDTDKLFSPISKNSSIYTITEYIDQHIGEELSVKEIAKSCNMSYSYFAQSFRNIYGQSCKKYIEFIRLCKVEDLLLFTNFDLTYISQETGFSDCSHLIKAFKAKNKITPHQFRLSK